MGNLPCVGAQSCAPYWRRFLPSTRRVKAPWQAARYACRLARSACRSSFPKISLRCDFREPCLLTEWRNLARCVSKDKCHYSTLGFPLGGSCHEVTDEGRWLLCISTPLFCRLRRHLPPKGKASLRRCVAYAAREGCNKKDGTLLFRLF